MKPAVLFLCSEMRVNEGGAYLRANMARLDRMGYRVACFRYQDLYAKEWKVCVRNVVQAQAGDKLAKIEKKEALKAQREATTKEAVVKVLETFPQGETARELTRRVGCNAGTLNAALEDLIESGQVEKCKTRKNTGTYDAYRLGEKGADASDATDATP